MATSILRPNGNPTVGGWTNTGGAASMQAALADNLDTTYARGENTDTLIVFDFGTVSIPAGAQVRSVTPRIRAAKIAGPGSDSLYYKVKITEGYGATNVATGLGATLETRSGGALSVSPSGDAWAQADIDGLQLELGRSGPGGGTAFSGAADFRVYEAYLDVLYDEMPVTVVTAPTEGGTVTDNVHPTVTWTFTDPELSAQERYQIKVFTAAQYGAGGFDPETSTPLWDSGEVFSAALTDVVDGTTLAGLHRAYVKTADAGSGGRYSAWDFNQFTIALNPSPTPTLTSVADNTLKRVTLTATSTGTPAVEFMRFEYSDDAGTTWAEVRGAERLAAANGVAEVTYDYEAPPNTLRSYRAFSIRVVSGNDVSSVASTTATATVTHAEWYLKDPTDASRNIRLRVSSTEIGIISPEPRGIFQPLGRTDQVVVTDVVKSDVIDLGLSFLTQADWALFATLRSSGRVLLLQSASTLQWYVRVGSDVSQSLIYRKDSIAQRKVDLTFVATTAP